MTSLSRSRRRPCGSANDSSRPAGDGRPRGTLSIERAHKELGFVPDWPLETGYKRYCEWYVAEWERAKRQLERN